MPHYLYPGTDCLKNKLGAKTHDELEQLEEPYVEGRYAEIVSGHGPQGQFDAEHLKAIHRHLFQDVYEWAGHTRDERVTLSDGTIATEPFLQRVGGSEFMVGPLIAGALDEVAAELRSTDYFRNLERDDIAVKAAADLMAKINAIHPFREGNGRAQRVFIEELVEQAGHDLDFTVISQERMVQASIAANDRGDPEPMRRLFADAIDPARAEALREAIDFLEGQRFDWDSRYVATVEPSHRVDARLVSIAGEHFMALTVDHQILVGNTTSLGRKAAHGSRSIRSGRFTTAFPASLATMTSTQKALSGNRTPIRTMTAENYKPTIGYSPCFLATAAGNRPVCGEDLISMKLPYQQLADARER